MGTSYHITLAHTVPPALRITLQRNIDALLEDINAKMSTYDPQSELSRFNTSKTTQPFPVSTETASVVAAALHIAQETHGAFDPTVGPLVNLWGFGPDTSRNSPPSETDIKKARMRTGYTFLKASARPPTLHTSRAGIQIDLSAIAKGYGVDAVSELLVKKGYTDFLVEIGGEVYTRGLNPKRKPWSLGIDRPQAGNTPGEKIAAIAHLKDTALATSGDYRNFFNSAGTRYSHFIDPRTGRPITHALVSVSVTAPSCMQADAVATAIMVMGLEEGRAYVKNLPGVEAFLITTDSEGNFKHFATPGFP